MVNDYKYLFVFGNFNTLLSNIACYHIEGHSDQKTHSHHMDKEY